MSKFQNRFDNYTKAVDRLREVIALYDVNKDIPMMNNIIRDSLIQRFEICYELSWKTIKEYMIFEGYEVGTSPRSILKAAYQNELLDSEELWLNMISDRNVASHEYNEDYINEVTLRIQGYFNQFELLWKKLQG